MNRTVVRIGVILLLIILLPAVFFSVKQFNSLNKNERILDEIYKNQLDAILFSINQYSSDILNAWAAEVDMMLNPEGEPIPERLIRFFGNKPDVRYLFITDSSDFTRIFLYNNSGGRAVDDEISSQISLKLIQNRESILRLQEYLNSNYRKIEPISMPGQSEAMLLFLPMQNMHTKLVCGFIVNPQGFIKNELSPKIEAVSQEKFIITVFSEEQSESIYSTASVPTNENISMHQTDFWLFPSYFMSIDLRGETIEALTQKRLSNDLLLILVLNLVIFMGAWFVFRNIKKEIELAQIKSDFVANVSHEIRTPLALISMFAETLQLGRIRSEDRKQEYYKIISQETARLSTMVNRILNFSKMEAGKYTYSMKESDLNSIVKNMVEAYDYHIRQQGFSFECFFADKNLYISGDEAAITEAFINLLDNAIKYSKDVKNISVRTGEKDGFAFVEVEDKGIGISEEDQKAIFEKFFRVTQGDVHNTKGTGLGLTLVKHIVDAHHGQVSIRSHLHQGSTFRMSFPLVRTENKKLTHA